MRFLLFIDQTITKIIEFERYWQQCTAASLSEFIWEIWSTTEILSRTWYYQLYAAHVYKGYLAPSFSRKIAVLLFCFALQILRTSFAYYVALKGFSSR